MPNGSRKPSTRSTRRSRGKPRRNQQPLNPVVREPQARYVPRPFARVIVHTFTRSCPVLTLSSSTVTDNFQSLSFQLSDLVGYTELTALYDQYQIVRVQVKIVPHVLTSSPLDPLTGYLLALVDYDDAANPSSLTAMLEYNNCAALAANERFITSIRPRAALAAYSGAFTSYANMGSMWVDVGSPNVQHYGLKLGLSSSTPVHSWTVFRTYCVRFKSSR